MAKKKSCESCGTKSDAVETMPDPMTTALYPEATDHDEMTLCPPCATARFEES
ncbi:hypothetical protein [Streptomyces sp. NPDC102283]|uniref:hypothetical protein n=1 Tax=Streptomyces sp. NPDC102283 TaxID=3366155 RepID=UPI00381A2882